MSGKRSRSFKCAVHHRDREVCSENDFHIFLEPSPIFRRMVTVIAMEVLPEERDRKYYADNYSCCPPPLFIILITLVEVSLQKKKKLSFSSWPNNCYPQIDWLVSCTRNINMAIKRDKSELMSTSCQRSKLCSSGDTARANKHINVSHKSLHKYATLHRIWD